MGMTLWSLETYGYIDSKTKSYQIQRGFLQLFIFLSSRPWPSGYKPSDLILLAVCLQNFCILGGTRLFTQAFSDPRSVLQSKPPFAEFLANPQKANFSHTSGLTKHQGAVLVVSNEPCLLPPAWWFQKPKALYRSRTLSCNYASYWPKLGLAIGWPSH